MTKVTPDTGYSFDFEKARDALKEDSSIAGEKIIYYHVTDFLEKSLDELRKRDKEYRIVIFIDDLDRCSPEKALEVLESIKSFFDVEGFVYVIGMDSRTINSLVSKKYGEGSAVEGWDYLQKIVQLPFQIPTWREIDISKAISKIVSKGLEGSPELVNEFENHKELIVKAVQLNPREVKRFINNIIFAKAVFGKPFDELIVVQALKFRSDWNKFLELISLDKKRKNFLNEHKKLMEEGQIITTKEELDKVLTEEKVRSNPAAFKDSTDVYQELVKQNNYTLRDFLGAGAIEILARIEKMEEHIRALDTTKPIEKEQKKPGEISSDSILKLLQEGNVEVFNNIRSDVPTLRVDFSGARFSDVNLSDVNLAHANLSDANLVRVNLSGANLSDANLAHANLSDARLSGANLSRANLSGARLSDADLLYANLSGANLSGARLSYANLTRANLSEANLVGTDLTYSTIGNIDSYEGMICENANLRSARIDSQKLIDYFKSNMAKNVPLR